MLSIALICSRSVEATKDILNEKMDPVDAIEDILIEQMDGIETEYILGLDRTEELMRNAINSVAVGNTDVCFSLLDLLQQMNEEFVKIDKVMMPRLMERKLEEFNRSLRKVEDACYAIKHQDLGSKASSSDLSFSEAVKQPSILIPLYSVFTEGISFGFLLATVKLDDFPGFHLSPLQEPSLLMAWQGSLLVCFPFRFLLPDNPKLVEISGAILISAGFIALGSLPLLPFQKTLTTTTIGMVIHGVGLSVSMVGGFHHASLGYSDLRISILGAVLGGALYSSGHQSGSITFDRATLIIVSMKVVNIALISF